MEVLMSKTKRFLSGAVLLAALAVAAPKNARAEEDKNFGLGLSLGTPTGLTGKIWLDDLRAVDFAVGTYGYYVGSSYEGVNLHADYLWHYYGIFGSPGSEAYQRMPLYAGVGGMYASPGVAGVRSVVGVTYLFREPFDLFVELAPTLFLVPGVGLGLDGGIGGRFYFY